MRDTQLLIRYYQIKLSAPSEWSITWNPRQTAQRGKLLSCAGVNRNACFSCHVSPWSPQLHQKRARLTMTASEVNYHRTFSVLFFPITVIWRETRYSACVNGFLSPSTFLLCKQQRLDDLFSECSVPTGGLFQPNFAQHFFSPPLQIPDHILELNHLLSCYASPSLSFHFQINKIFISLKPLQTCAKTITVTNQSCLAGILLIALWWTQKRDSKPHPTPIHPPPPPPKHCTPLFHILHMERPSQPFLLHFPRFIDAARWTGTFQLPPHQLIIPPEISSLYLLDK